jgi:hypothetical protein
VPLAGHLHVVSLLGRSGYWLHAGHMLITFWSHCLVMCSLHRVTSLAGYVLVTSHLSGCQHVLDPYAVGADLEDWTLGGSDLSWELG